MEKFEIELVSVPRENPSFSTNIRMALVNGFFMQVAHKGGAKGKYKTVKDHQVRTRGKARRAISDKSPPIAGRLTSILRP